MIFLPCLLPLISAQYFNNNQQPTTQGYQNFWEQNVNDPLQKATAYGRGIVNQILTPINNSQNEMPQNGAVTIQFQLRSYSNPASALPNGWTCVCPPGKSCSYFKTEPYCSFAFTFIISTPDQSVRYLTTDFIRLEPNGQLPPMVGGNSKRWDENFVVQLPTKPSAIDVFAHHLGAVISQDGSLVAADTLTHADTWVVPLNGVLPAVGGVQGIQSQNTFDGKLLGTRLSLSYSIACSGSLVGPACDLSCTQSTVNSQVAACRSNSTGFFSVCQYQTMGQVDNCKNCPWGIKDNTYCQDEDGDVLDPHTAGVVDTSYKTATVVLAILLAILFILLILALISLCIFPEYSQKAIRFLVDQHRRRRRAPVEKEMVTYTKSAEGPATQPLLNSSFRDSDMPTPVPRSNPPSLDAKPLRSALRKPMMPMNPSASNDTRDTSFSNDIPMRPSRSEVV